MILPFLGLNALHRITTLEEIKHVGRYSKLGRRSRE
jgi:hypothetical protein